MRHTSMKLLKVSDFFRGDVDQAFDLNDRPPPTILFDPPESALPHESFRLFSKICDDQAVRPGGAIPRSALRMDDFGGMADFIVIVERDTAEDEQGGQGPDAWRFTYSGWEIDFAQTEELSGRLITEVVSGPVALLMTQVWTHAASELGSRVLTAHTSPRNILQADWTVLSVPLLAQKDGTPTVDGFIFYARAMNKLTPGLDLIPDPVLVVDADQRIRMVNEAARTVFEDGRKTSSVTVSLADYTCSDLELAGPGVTPAIRARRLRKTCRCLLNGRVVPMQATIAPLYHDGVDYMVVMLQPE